MFSYSQVFNRKPSSKFKAQLLWMFLLYYFQLILLLFHLLKYFHVPTLIQFLIYFVVKPPLHSVLTSSSYSMLIWVLLDQNIFLLNWFLIFKLLSKIYLDFILALWTKTVKNQQFKSLLTQSKV